MPVQDLIQDGQNDIIS